MAYPRTPFSKLQIQIYEQSDTVCVAGAALGLKKLKFSRGDTTITKEELSELKKLLKKETSKLSKYKSILAASLLTKNLNNIAISDSVKSETNIKICKVCGHSSDNFLYFKAVRDNERSYFAFNTDKLTTSVTSKDDETGLYSSLFSHGMREDDFENMDVLTELQYNDFIVNEVERDLHF